jgi:hypothetical protein
MYSGHCQQVEVGKDDYRDHVRKGRHMNARSIRNRLLRVERKIHPSADMGFTLEELCRCMWREDKRKFMEIAKDSSLTLFVHQFKVDDASRGGVDGEMRRLE